MGANNSRARAIIRQPYAAQPTPGAAPLESLPTYADPLTGHTQRPSPHSVDVLRHYAGTGALPSEHTLASLDRNDFAWMISVAQQIHDPALMERLLAARFDRPTLLDAAIVYAQYADTLPDPEQRARVMQSALDVRHRPYHGVNPALVRNLLDEAVQLRGTGQPDWPARVQELYDQYILYNDDEMAGAQEEEQPRGRAVRQVPVPAPLPEEEEDDGDDHDDGDESENASEGE